MKACLLVILSALSLNAMAVDMETAANLCADDLVTATIKRAKAEGENVPADARQRLDAQRKEAYAICGSAYLEGRNFKQNGDGQPVKFEEAQASVLRGMFNNKAPGKLTETEAEYYMNVSGAVAGAVMNGNASE